MADISVVIPVYNAETCIRELCQRLVSTLAEISDNFEIVLIDDASPDRSWGIIEEIAASDPHVKGIRFSHNFGQHHGITAGLDYCNGDRVVIMDCDLQDKPENIKFLYKKAVEGYDVVLAIRGERKDPLLKILFSRMFYRIFNYLTDMNYDWQIGNFMMISRKVVENFRSMRENLRFFGALISWMGFSTARISVEHGKQYRPSAYTFKKRMNLALSAIIAFSDKPLRLITKFGFFIALVSFLFGILLLIKSLLYGSPVMGWSSLIVSLYFIGGIIILILGIIGIYIGKIFSETKKRPLYIIQSTKNLSSHA
jgi:dolichol-phosphate mannosyltransferase